MRKPLICFVMAITLLAGCRQREDEAQLKATAQALQNANTIIQEANLMIQDALVEKQCDPAYRAYADVWAPKASQIKGRADSIVAFIEELKKELIKQTDSLKKEETSVIAQFHATDGSGYKLLNKLAELKGSFLLIIDPVNHFGLTKEVDLLVSTVPLLPGFSDSLNEAQRKQYAKKWVEDNFLRTSAVMAMVVLSRIENEVMATVRTFMKFCLDQMPITLCNWRGFRGVATLNSSYVKRGQPIEVMAALGEFNAVGNPRIAIGGKEIKLDNDAVAVHHFIATGKPGKHSVRVKFEYARPDGTSELVYKDLKYIIADEK